MQFSTAFCALSLSAVAQCTNLLLPLYVYPNDTNWAPIYSALTDHPTLDFYIVVNPGNGPTPQPDANYVQGIENLRTHSNAHVVAYVATGHGTTPASTIEADIDEWKGWPASVRPTGVFFDEAERGEVPGSWAILEQVASYARSNSLGDFVVYNLGTRPTNDTVYGFADQSIIYEDSWANYPASSAEIDAIDVPASELSIIIYSLPSEELSTQVDKFVERGYGSVYFTSGPGYTAVYDDWEQFVSLLDAAT